MGLDLDQVVVAQDSVSQENANPMSVASSDRRIPIPGHPDVTCLAPGIRLSGYELRFKCLEGQCVHYVGTRQGETRLIKEAPSQAEAATALRQEAQLLKGLRHANLARAYQTISVGGYVYLVLDYIEGTNLGLWTTTEAHSVAEPTLLNLALQMCDLFQFLYKQAPRGSYRIEPSGLVVTKAGQIFLTGLAPYQRKEFPTASPEHVSGTNDSRSDVYSLGATLFLLAAPGSSPSPQSSSLRKVKGEFSAAFETILQGCLHKEPARRFANVKEVSTALRALVKEREPEKPVPPAGDFWLRKLTSLHGRAAKQSGDLRDIKVPLLVIVMFTRQMCTLLNGGTSLVVSLNTLIHQHDSPDFGRVIQAVVKNVESGNRLSVSLAQYPRIFSRLYVTMVQVGEATGDLEGPLARLANWLERDLAMTQQIRSALAYPIFVIILSFFLTVALVYTILPGFISIFEDMKIELPLVTRIVVAATRSIQSPWLWIALLLGGYGTYRTIKSMQADRVKAAYLFRLITSTPLIGGIFFHSSLARFAICSDVMLSTGLPMSTTLSMAASASGSPLLSLDAEHLVQAVIGGEMVSTHMRSKPDLYSNTMIQFTLAGEEAANLPEMLGRVGSFHALEAEDRIQALGSAIEPVLLVGVSLVVGTIIISIFLPLYGVLSKF